MPNLLPFTAGLGLRKSRSKQLPPQKHAHKNSRGIWFWQTPWATIDRGYFASIRHFVSMRRVGSLGLISRNNRAPAQPEEHLKLREMQMRTARGKWRRMRGEVRRRQGDGTFWPRRSTLRDTGVLSRPSSSASNTEKAVLGVRAIVSIASMTSPLQNRPLAAAGLSLIAPTTMNLPPGCLICSPMPTLPM